MNSPQPPQMEPWGESDNDEKEEKIKEKRINKAHYATATSILSWNVKTSIDKIFEKEGTLKVSTKKMFFKGIPTQKEMFQTIQRGILSGSIKDETIASNVANDCIRLISTTLKVLYKGLEMRKDPKITYEEANGVVQSIVKDMICEKRDPASSIKEYVQKQLDIWNLEIGKKWNPLSKKPLHKPE